VDRDLLRSCRSRRARARSRGPRCLNRARLACVHRAGVPAGMGTGSAHRGDDRDQATL